jgi:metallo-beta-lactamase class B
LTTAYRLRRSLKGAAAALAALFIAGPAAAEGAPALKLTPSETWNNPVAPFRIADGLYYVGAADIAAYLIVTDAGLLVIDGGHPETAGQILANIKALGFDPKAVKILLSSHAHFDHAGGLAELKTATGAQLYASAEDGALMKRGGKGDFFLGDKHPYPPVTPDHVLADGDKVTIGDVVLTAHITAGHTKGCTTWTFPVKVDGQPKQALVLCSLSILPGYRLVGDPAYPNMADDYAKSYATLKALPCEVFLASHGQFFGLPEKRLALRPDAPNPFVDPEGCKTYFSAKEAEFQAELKRQKSAAPHAR